jgi:hypothetical protein
MPKKAAEQLSEGSPLTKDGALIVKISKCKALYS